MNKNQSLDAAYLAAKRKELIALRDQLKATARTAQGDQRAVIGEASQQSQGYEDDAQKLDQLDTQGELVNRTVGRLQLIERALAKIEDGTYGYSDESGARIPDARLDAVPEAVTTVAEQEAQERTK